INILTRAKFCARRGDKLFGSPPLCYFLYHDYGKDDFINDPKVIDTFVKLDDIDIMGAIKVWTSHEDPILSDLCSKLTNRKLPGVILSKSPFDENELSELKQKTKNLLNLNDDEVKYYFHLDALENHAYDRDIDGINILT